MELTLLLIGTVLACLAAARNPQLGAAIYIQSFIIEQLLQRYSPYFSDNRAMANYAAFAIIATSAASNLPTFLRQARLLPATLAFTLLTYTLAALSFTWSIAPEISKQVVKSGLPYFIAYVILFPACIATRQQLGAFLSSYPKLATPSTILLLLSTFLGRGVQLAENEVLRSGSPLTVATFACITCITSLHQGRNGKSKNHRYLYYALSALSIILLLRTGSRGQIVALLLSLPAISYFSVQHKTGLRKILATTATILTGVAIIISAQSYLSTTEWASPIKHRLTLGNTVTEYSRTRGELSQIIYAEWRTQLRRSSLVAIVGLGAGASYTVAGTYAHVLVVESLFEYGGVGLTLLLCVLVCHLNNVYRGARKFKRLDRDTRLLFATSAAITFFYILLSFKQGNLFTQCDMFGIIIITDRIYNSLLPVTSPLEPLAHLRHITMATTMNKHC